MKKLTIPFFFCFLVLLPISGVAADKNVVTDREKAALLMKTSGDLYTLCSLEPQSALYDKGLAFCYGFVSGAMSFYGAIADSPKTPKVICTDHDIPRGVMVETFLRWAENNQDKMQESPIDGLVRAAMDRWPCPQKQGEN